MKKLIALWGILLLCINPAFADSYNGGGGGGTPGGSTGQLQYNNAGVFGGVPAVNGDGTLNTATGALSVTKSGGVSFSPSATTDTTNAANITSGTLPASRLPFNPAYATKWRVAFANVINGTASCRIGCIGDSTTAGFQGASNNHFINVTSWPFRLQQLLKAQGIPACEGVILLLRAAYLCAVRAEYLCAELD